MRLATYLDKRILESVTEADFQQQVIDLAKLCGWRTYFTYNSRRSPFGFPDLCMVRPPRLLFCELKVESRTKGKLTPAQLEWIADLHAVNGVEVYVFRPSDWERIVEVLKR